MEKNYYLEGFSDNERSVIDTVLTARGYIVRELDDKAVEILTELKNPSMVLVGVYDDDGLKTVKRLLTNASQHIFAFGILYEKRKLLFSLIMACDFPVFFLPVDEKELKKVISMLQSKAAHIRASGGVFEGLNTLNQAFEWKTADIRISETCRYIAGIMRQAGFYGDSNEQDRAVLSLEEALVNSVEHGNLELDSSLRPVDIMAEDLYEKTKEERLKDREYASRKIFIAFEINNTYARVSIKDQGQGFDTSKITRGTVESEDISRNKIMEVSGKGLNLIQQPFDTVKYNDRGTEITLVKKRGVQ